MSKAKKRGTSLASAVDQFVQIEMGVALTPAALSALSDCHDAFLSHLGTELVGSSGTGVTADGGAQRIQPHHVETILDRIGLSDVKDVANHAVAQSQTDKTSSGTQRQPTKRRKAWTKEQEEEQERLLERAKQQQKQSGPGEREK